MASLIKQKNNYYIQFYDASKHPPRKHVPTGTSSKSTAKKIFKQLEAQYLLHEYDPWNPDAGHEANSSIPTLSKALEQYLAEKSSQDWRENTYIANSTVLKKMVDILGEDLPPDQLKAGPINAFINDAQLAYETKRGYKAKISCFLRWLHRKKFTERALAQQLKLFNRGSEQQETIHYLSPSEFETIFETIKAKVVQDIKSGYQTKERNALWLIDFISWQRYSGMRVSETLNLRAGDIDADCWQVTIGNNHFTTKSKRKQVLPIDSVRPLKQIASQWLKQSSSREDRLFGHSCRWRTSKLFKKYLRLALPHRQEIKLHSLRHTCCIELLKAGVSIYKVQRWMRHGDVRTTQRYADVLNLDLSQTIGEAFNS